MSEERKADVTVAELQDNGCLTGDCPHGSASDCLDHLTLMIGMLRDSDGEEDAGPRADLPPDVVTRIQNFLDGHPADDTIIKLADAKGRPFTHVTAGWLRSILATHPKPTTEPEGENESQIVPAFAHSAAWGAKRDEILKFCNPLQVDIWRETLFDLCVEAVKAEAAASGGAR